VTSLAQEYRPAFKDPQHRHPHAQLLYACRGVMSVVTPAARFTIPPQRALWIPAGLDHEVSCRGQVSLRTLYFAAWPGPFRDCGVVEVTPFLRALIVEAASFAAPALDLLRQRRIIDLLMEELKAAPVAPYGLPMPDSAPLRRACQSFLDDPAIPRPLDTWARLAGMGRRTFTRSFREAAGMAWGAWTRQARLMESLALLDAGHPVTEVAYRLGYASPGAFSVMFRQALGYPPSRYQGDRVRLPDPER
jgi:AraC-like DNA-binding protein